MKPEWLRWAKELQAIAQIGLTYSTQNSFDVEKYSRIREIAAEMIASCGGVALTDKSKLKPVLIHDWLSKASYWARGCSPQTVQRSIENSLCFGVYEGDHQVGFARVVSDYATFAWLCDVFILEAYRGQGLGKWLIRTIVSQPALHNLHLFLLATEDAHGLYERHGGFHPLQAPERWMARVQSNT